MNRMGVNLLLIAVLLFGAFIEAEAAPTISSTSGTFSHGSTVTITGSSFGSKSPAKPLIWADFESSFNPTSLGIKTAWDATVNLMLSSDCPVGKCAKASDGSGSWALAVDFNSWTNDGQKFYIYRRQKLNFLIQDVSQNWKILRVWPPAANGNYPNLYVSPSSFEINVEDQNGTAFYGVQRLTTTDWLVEEFIVRASTFNVKDGTLTYRNNNLQNTTGNIRTRESARPEFMVRNYVVHGVLANKSSWIPPWNDNNRMWVDDVYVDTTWARVMICEASTYSGCRQLAIQIPSAWSDTAITIRVNLASLPSSNAYLYVFDANGNVNSNGYPLCDQCAVPPRPPTNLRVN